MPKLLQPFLLFCPEIMLMHHWFAIENYFITYSLMLAPQILHSTCGSVLGQDTEPQIAPNGCAIGIKSVWRSDEQVGSLWRNNSLLTCVLKALWVVERVDKCYKNSAFAIYWLSTSLKIFILLLEVGKKWQRRKQIQQYFCNNSLLAYKVI